MKKILYTLLIVLTSSFAFAQTGLKKEDVAPGFNAKDNSGRNIDLKSILKTHKVVVLFFYRGQWCPYCNKYISSLQDSLSMLTAKGAYVVGVTPETDENIGKTVEKTHASFSLIHDKNYDIMKAYKVNYTMNADMLKKYKSYGVDLEKNNGNTDHVLPVPATYIIGQNGRILFVQFDPDYTKRPAVSLLAKAF